MRQAAVEALGELGDPAALDALAGALFDGDESVREAAAEALGSGSAERGLPEAVEWCKQFLFGLQPLTVVITRLDAYYARPDRGQASSDTLIARIKRLSSFGARSRTRLPVWVIGVGGYSYLPKDTPVQAQASELVRWETLPMARLLRNAGADVLHWDPSHERFATALLRHMHSARAHR